jgi:hypothetical protein
MSQAQEVFLFQPTQVSGCQLWLDAADSSTITLSGTSVTAWRDKSSLSNNYVQTNSSYYPTYVLDPVYNAKGIRFINGTGTHLTPQTTSLYSINAANWTTFVVVRYSDSNISSGTVQSISRTINSGNNWIRYHQGAMSFYIVTSDVQFGRVFSAVSGIYCAVVTNSQTVYQNGTLAGSGSRSSTPIVSDAFNIGGNGTGEGMSGYIFEYIIYNGVGLSTSQRQQVEGYLAWKWGLQGNLPSNHPYKSYRPLAQTPFPTQIPPMPITTKGTLPFAPTQISGCRLWFDAADSASIILSSGSNVSSWRDKSGNGNNVISGGTAPRYSSASNAIVFNGNGYLINTLFTLALANRSVFIVCNQTASSSNAFEGILVFGNSNITDYNSSNAIVYNGRGSNVNANCSFGVFFNYAYNNSGDYKVNYGNYLTPAPFAIYNDVFSNPSGTLYVNGNTTDSDSIGGSIGTSTAFFLGARNDFGNGTYRSFFNGSIYEIIVYNTAIALAQRQQLEGYLAWKWGLISSLPNGHPYKTAPLAPFPFRTIAFNGSSSSWQPIRITGSTMWLDGADPNGNGITPGNGAIVSNWVDKSGTGNSVTGGGNQPTYSTNASNKLGALSFNGSQWLSKASVSGGSLAGNNTTTFSMFVVCSFSNNTLRSMPFSWDNSSYTYRILFQYSEDNNLCFDFNNITGARVNIIPFVPTNNQFYIFSGIRNGSVAYLGINGGVTTATATGLVTQNFSGTTNTLNIGQYVNGSDWNMKGITCEIIFYNSALSVSQRQNVEGYLAWKWGLQGSLPANHPYKLFPPAP